MATNRPPHADASDKPVDPAVEAHRDESGATMLEYALLLGVIAIPSYWIIRAGLAVLVGHYQMITTINGLPFP